MNEFYLEECRKLLEHWWGIACINPYCDHIVFCIIKSALKKCRTCVSNVVKGGKKREERKMLNWLLKKLQPIARKKRFKRVMKKIR